MCLAFRRSLPPAKLIIGVSLLTSTGWAAEEPPSPSCKNGSIPPVPPTLPFGPLPNNLQRNPLRIPVAFNQIDVQMLA